MRKAVYQLFFGNLSSKLVGFIREILTAAIFGTGNVIAAYRISLTGILSPINFLTSDILNTAFVPKYKAILKEDEDQAQTLFYTLVALFLVFSLLLMLLLYLFSSEWITLMAPNLDKSTLNLTRKMFDVIIIAIPFYLLSALFFFLSMARNDFVPMAIRPLVQNVGMIAGALLTFFLGNLLYLAWGFTLAYVAFLIWVFFRALRLGFLKLPKLWKLAQIKDVLNSFWITLRPLIFLPFMLQGNILVERMVASLISVAAISAVDYAKFVTETMVLMISTPLAFAGLSHWSGITFEEMRKKLLSLIPFLNMISIPVSLFLVINAYDVVNLIYVRGEFNEASAKVTSEILYGIAWGLWAQVISYVLVKSLSAQLLNRSVMIITIAALLANILFNVATYKIIGAFALGLGNTIYGLVLLCLCLAKLKLVASYIRHSWIFVLIGFVYFVIANYLIKDAQGSVLYRLIIQSLFATFFWLSIYSLIPSFRTALFSILRFRR